VIAARRERPRAPAFIVERLVFGSPSEVHFAAGYVRVDRSLEPLAHMELFFAQSQETLGVNDLENFEPGAGIAFGLKFEALGFGREHLDTPVNFPDFFR
jgi:hypothetical protein